MATTVTIYPSVSIWHEKADRNWSTARSSASSDIASSSAPSRVGIILSGDYSFYRIYMSFDLSVVPVGSTIDSIRISLKRVDSIKTGYIPIVAYAGNSEVRRVISEYKLYLTSIIGGKRISIVNLTDETRYYTSDPFDIATYRIFPGDTLSIGIIDANDFGNSVNGTSNLYLIDTDPAGNQPYIEVTYTAGGGYNKPVMGISNFTNLNGIPSANIVSVMGVI